MLQHISRRTVESLTWTEAPVLALQVEIRHGHEVGQGSFSKP